MRFKLITKENGRYKKTTNLFRKWFLWCEPGLNRRHMDFQSIALPTELSHHISKKEFKEIFPRRGGKNRKIKRNEQNLLNFNSKNI